MELSGRRRHRRRRRRPHQDETKSGHKTGVNISKKKIKP